MAKRKTDTAKPFTKDRSSRKGNLFRHIVIILIAGTLLFGTAGFFMLSTIVGKVIMQNPTNKIKNAEPSSIIADDGKTQLGEWGGISRENVTYKQIPQSVIDAFLSIEDSRYFKHNGFDLPRFISSAITNLKTGSFAQGGSTLTMQLIDNAETKPEEAKLKAEGKSLSKLQKVEGKIQEIYLAMKLESEWSKEEIITKYLNEINFGGSALGIQKGAQYYFGKDVSDLNLSESAFLAGVINAPNFFDPYNGSDYYERAMQRRNKTLDMMLYHGFITKKECALAKSTKLAFELHNTMESSNSEKYRQPLWEARNEVMRLTGKDPAIVPMTVYTSINVKAQDEANALSAGQGLKLPNNKYYQIGSTMINNANGEIVAVSGERTDIKTDGFKTRYNEPKQPGSTVKPLLDYGPAFENLGWCTSRVMSDREPFKIDSQHLVYNSDHKFNGDVTLERALAQSLNTIALQTMQANIDKSGTDRMIEYVKEMGLDNTTANDFNIQYAIGGSDLQFSPTQLAAAYASFGNGGMYIKPHMIRKVVLKDSGTTIEEKTDKKQLFSPQTAYMVSDLLYKVVNGEYKRYNLLGLVDFSAYPVYGKTGTTNWTDSQAAAFGGAMKDEWTVNYTNEYTIATWTGFDQGIPGGNTAINDYLYMNVNTLFNKHMLDKVTTKNVKKIARPNGISEYGGGYIKSEYLKDAAKNNPKTQVNTSNDFTDLSALIASANAYKKDDYTDDSFKAMQDALNAAQKIMADDTATSDQAKAAKEALQKAMDGLVKKTPATDFSALNALNKTATTYLDISKYNSDKVIALQNAISNGISVANNKKATQADVDGAVNAINQAIQDCINNPITTPAPAPTPSPTPPPAPTPAPTPPPNPAPAPAPQPPQ